MINYAIGYTNRATTRQQLFSRIITDQLSDIRSYSIISNCIENVLDAMDLR